MRINVLESTTRGPGWKGPKFEYISTRRAFTFQISILRVTKSARQNKCISQIAQIGGQLQLVLSRSCEKVNYILLCARRQRNIKYGLVNKT